MSAPDPFELVQKIASDLSQGVIIFPTAFDTTVRLRKAMSSENTSNDEVAAIIGRDPLLASKVVRAANSAALNPSGGTITAIPAAVMRIGRDGVRIIALALAMQQLRRSKVMVRFDALSSAIMAHSQRIAAVAHILARERSSLCKDSALFAGLVHDIGAFYLIYRIAEQQDIDISDDDLEEMLRDWHSNIGHAVLSALGIPEQILDAVADHDEPRAVTSLRSLKDVIYCAHAVEVRLDSPAPEITWRREIPDPASISDCDLLVGVANRYRQEIDAMMNWF